MSCWQPAGMYRSMRSDRGLPKHLIYVEYPESKEERKNLPSDVFKLGLHKSNSPFDVVKSYYSDIVGQGGERTVSAHRDGELKAGVGGLAGNLGQVVALVHTSKGPQVVRAARRDGRRAACDVDLRSTTTKHLYELDPIHALNLYNHQISSDIKRSSKGLRGQVKNMTFCTYKSCIMNCHAKRISSPDFCPEEEA